MGTELKEDSQSSSYRGIFKATSLFGGVQVYQILIEIIKSKFIAVLLGPLGVGIQGLYTSGIQMIQQISSLGLSSSAVRNIAEANGSGEVKAINKTVTALRRLVWVTGIIGMVAVIAFSSILSESSFGDHLHVWGFIALSITLLLTQISAGQKVILQGTRKYKHLAKCATYGVTLGLFISIPLYYLWGIKAIVPNLIINSLTLLLLSWHYSRKVKIEPVKMSFKETFNIGKGMMTMGVAMCISQFLSTASAFALRSCIRMWGSVDEVGLYTAGFLLMTQYTGLVFSAMATDFYPRLAAVNTDNEKCRLIMNQQGEIGLLLIAPLLVLCIVYIPVVVVILYSDKFLAVDSYIVWCSVGMAFKMVSWAISYVFIAKAESRLFMYNEMAVGVYTLLLSLLGYKLAGLQGLGIAFMLSYILYVLQVYTIAHQKYSFTFSSALIKIFLVQLSLICISLLFVFTLPSLFKYIVGTVVFIASLSYSIYELNKRLDLTSFINKKLLKKDGK